MLAGGIVGLLHAQDRTRLQSTMHGSVLGAALGPDPCVLYEEGTAKSTQARGLPVECLSFTQRSDSQGQNIGSACHMPALPPPPPPWPPAPPLQPPGAPGRGLPRPSPRHAATSPAPSPVNEGRAAPQAFEGYDGRLRCPSAGIGRACASQAEWTPSNSTFLGRCTPKTHSPARTDCTLAVVARRACKCCCCAALCCP